MVFIGLYKITSMDFLIASISKAFREDLIKIAVIAMHHSKLSIMYKKIPPLK